MSEPAPPRGPVQVGRYVLFKSLKKGGMARVFLAVDPEEPRRLLAVKTLLPELAKDKLYRDMFATEGKVGLRLQHPNIVRTLESGTDDATAFIAMELIQGHDLSTVIRRLRRAGELMPLPLAVGLARDVAAALCYAHELQDEHGQPLNIVNRDVSPGNIMLAFDGSVKLIDFGIAQTTIDVKNQIGTIKGKLSYMSPEQVRGLPVDARSDVFSVGTVLYEMLTGVHVFHDEGDFATMERVRRAEFAPASTHNAAVDAELDDLLTRAMARDLSNRFHNSRELWRSLKEYLAARGLSSTPAEVSGYLRTVFGTEIESLLRDVEAARAQALDAGAEAPPLRAGRTAHNSASPREGAASPPSPGSPDAELPAPVAPPRAPTQELRVAERSLRGASESSGAGAPARVGAPPRRGRLTHRKLALWAGAVGLGVALAALGLWLSGKA